MPRVAGLWVAAAAGGVAAIFAFGADCGEEAVVAELKSESGKMFDPELVEIFLQNMDTIRHIASDAKACLFVANQSVDPYIPLLREGNDTVVRALGSLLERVRSAA